SPGNSNVTFASACARSEFFFAPWACAGVDKQDRVRTLSGPARARAQEGGRSAHSAESRQLETGRQRSVLGLERGLAASEQLDRLVERVAVVRGHHTGTQQRTRGRD